MKRKLLSVAILAGVFSLPSLATNISYSTSGIFTSSGTASDAYFTYTGSGTSNVTDPFPTAGNFGSFTASGKSGSVTDTFVLTVTQTVPNAGKNVLTSATFSGQISGTSSGVQLSFAGDGPVLNYPGNALIGFNIGGVEYGLEEYTVLSPISSNGGLTTLSGLIVGVPEPSAMLLGGLGLLALLAGSLRRRKQIAQTTR